MLKKIVKPLSAKVSEVVVSIIVALSRCVIFNFQDFFEKHRGSKLSNHLNTVKDGIGCVGWVTVVSDLLD